MDSRRNENELVKGKPHTIAGIAEYIPNAIQTRDIIKKNTGNITMSSVEAGVELSEKMLPFDVFIQMIDGEAELEINKIKYKLKVGEGIIIPAHSLHQIKALKKFKMISTIIKSGYEI